MQTSAGFQPSLHFSTFATYFLDACGSTLNGASRARQWDKIIAHALTPEFFTDDLDLDFFRRSYYAAEAFSKTPFELPGINREAAALAKFYASEADCGSANTRLCDGLNRPSLRVPWGRVRNIVRGILGDFSWDKALGYMSFGPGASTGLSRRRSNPANKWAFSSHVTSQCYELVACLHRWWGIPLRELEVQDWNVILTVPKSAKTDRIIAKEPDWNMFVQRGIGQLIRRQLWKLGLLTPSAQFCNRKLAQEGSRTGALATIDLSAASDSISLALCELCLPADWLSAVMLSRAPLGRVGHEIVTYEKVSSMGNGFTFELETLLFYAISRAVATGTTVSVYGDDIVIATEDYERVVDALSEAGMTVNSKKSHHTGFFRESCGGHFYHGADVTPPYFKTNLRAPAEFIRFGNKCLQAARRGNGDFLDDRFRSVWEFCRDHVPRRFWGPESLGDGCLWTDFESARPRTFRVKRNGPILGTWVVSEGPEPGVTHCRLEKPIVRALGPTPRGRYAISCFVKKDLREEVEDPMGGIWASLWGKFPEDDDPVTASFASRSGGWKEVELSSAAWGAPGVWLTLA